MRKALVLTVVLLLVFSAGNAFATEIITNGGFEDGLTGWSTTINVFSWGTWWGISPTEGNYQAVMAPLGVLDAELSQVIDLSLYTEVTVSFDYNLKAYDWSRWIDIGTDYLSVTCDSTELLRVELNDPYGNGKLPNGATALGWQTFSGTYSVDALVGPLTFEFYLENFPPGGGDLSQELVCYIDNVSIDATPIPEPTSLILFGSGLLGLAGFFRRKGKENRRETEQY